MCIYTMVFDQGTFSEFVEDGRYDLLKKPVKIDKSNRAYEIQFIPPATTKGIYTLPDGGGHTYAISAWNATSQTHYIDVYAGSDYKVNLQGSYLKVSYYAAQGRVNGGVNFVGCPALGADKNAYIAAGTSLPWNPLFMFQTIALKGNQSQTPIEQYINNNNLQHISTLRYLLKYKREAMENDDQTLFTPCAESTYDIDGVLSNESADRGIKWLGAAGDAGAASASALRPKRFTKNIPLSDIFECCESPAIFNNLNRFRLEFTFRDPITCLFASGVAAGCGPVAFIVDDIQFVFDSTRMAPVQAIETAVEKQQGSIENVAYFQNEVIPWTFAGNSQVVATGQRDVQMVAFGIPALGQIVPNPETGEAMGAVCINPLQYFSGGITSINCQYGSDMPLRTPLSLSAGTVIAVQPGGIQKSIYDNTLVYTLFKKCCNADRSSLVPVSLNYRSFPMYNLFCFPIYNQSMVHRQADPKDIRIDNASPLDHLPSVIIIRKFAGLQIDSSGSIDRL